MRLSSYACIRGGLFFGRHWEWVRSTGSRGHGEGTRQVTRDCRVVYYRRSIAHSFAALIHPSRMSATPSSPASLAATDADFPPSKTVSSPVVTEAAVCARPFRAACGDLIAAGFGI